MSSLVGLKKVSYLIFRKSTDFGNFWLTGSTFKVGFFNVQANFKKSLLSFLRKVVRNIVLKFGLSISSGLRREGGGGVSRFASRHFPKSVILARFFFCGAAICSLLCLFYCYFRFLAKISFSLLLKRLISIGYSLTNRRKTAIFDDFRLFWAFLGDFFLSSPK